MSGNEGRTEDCYSREGGGGGRGAPRVSKQPAPDSLPNAWVVKETSHTQRPGGQSQRAAGSSGVGVGVGSGVSGDLGGKCGTFSQKMK